MSHISRVYPAIIVLICTAAPCLGQPPAEGQVQQPARDSVRDQYFVPQFVLEHAESLNLSDEQMATARKLNDAIQAQKVASDERLRASMLALNETVDVDPGDERAVMAKLKDILLAEAEIKRAHLRSLVRVYKLLTTDQLADIHTIKAELVTSMQEMEQRIQQKFNQVRQLAQAQAKAGTPPTAVAEMMKPFQQLAQSRKYQQAEQLLDMALEQLHANENVTPIDVGELLK